MAFNDQIKIIADARKKFEEASQKRYNDRIEVQRKFDPKNLTAVENRLSGSDNQYFAAHKQLQEAIKHLYTGQTHRQLTQNLEARFPILFLPVRVETRFVTLPGGPLQLWVRIYPDDIHVHSHEARLTDEEVQDGQNYWLSLLAANRMTGGDPTASKQAAWKIIADRRGPNRAQWIARQTMPTGWKPDLKVEDHALQFPVLETKTHDWTLAPRTQLLPDRFVVAIYKGDKSIYSQLGAPIPDTLFLGPDPFKGEKSIQKNGKDLKFDEEFAWMADFDRAVTNGMAMRMNAPQEFFNQGRIERILVCGLMHSADPAQGSALVEQMLTNHRFSAKGLSLVGQGTPTNNTEDGSSGYTRNEDDLPLGYYDGAVSNLFAQKPNCEGKRAATLLGIAPGMLETVRNAGLEEFREAQAMNRALYPATMGSYFTTLMKPVVKENAQKQLRSFFSQFVTARGPLPAFRIGDQPYGLLLTSNLSAWNEGADAFFAPFTNVLRGLQTKWNSIAATKAVHVAMPGDPSALLLRILSLQAGSVDFKQRLGNLPDYSLTAPNIDVEGLSGSIKTKQQQIVDFLKTLGFNPGADDNYYPFISNMAFYNRLYPVPQQNLVDRVAAADTRFLEKLPVQKRNYIEWLASVKTLQALEKQDMGGDKAPFSILYLLLRHALILEMQRKTTDFYRAGEYAVETGAFVKSLINFQPAKPDLSAWELMRGAPKTLNAQKFTIAEPFGDYLLKAKINDPIAEGVTDVRAALNILAPLPTARLERYLSDHLDLCSYRLDAWQTGLFHRRLTRQRAAAPNGLYLGAYAWLENLKPESRTVVPPQSVPEKLRPAGNAQTLKLAGNAGFVHTPSLNHAAAAGLLLAGYHNHANRSAPGTFAVNLSSERVRRAMFLLEGIRNGQMLEALLGYQFERALHDITTKSGGSTNLNQYILPIRNKFPVQHQSIPQQGSPEVQEAFTAYPVVNGFRLTQAPSAEFNALVPNAAHRQLVKREIDRLADTLDAANDLLLSESAYHITQGNAERTAAVLNAQRNAEAPPDVEVIKTPRGSQFTYTNRASLHFSTATNSMPGNWTTVASPRAQMEPGLNQWLGAVFGAPETILCEASVDAPEIENQHPASVSLNDLRLQPIDFVYIMGGDVAAGATELEARVAREYRRIMNVGALTPVRIRFDIGVQDGLKSFAQAFPLARALRALITASRPASARDFTPQTKDLNKSGAKVFGWAPADLQKRVETVSALLSGLLKAINTEAPNQQASNENNPATFREVFARCAAEGGAPEFIAGLPLTKAAAERLERFMRDAAEFGIPVAYPDFYNLHTRQNAVEILTKSASIWKTLTQKLDLAGKKIAAAAAETEPDQKIQRLIEAGKALLGDEFNVIPRFHYNNPDDIKASLKDRKQLMAYFDGLASRTDEGRAALEGWLQSTARVRPGMDRLEKVRMIGEALDSPALDPQPVQLPFRKNDSWLGVEFPKKDPETGKAFQLKNDTIAFVMHGENLEQVKDLQSALILDDWTETIPVDKEITGLAYHYNQPNAVPPQSLLLAVEPTGGKQWDWEVILNILNDTLQRAKTRAVEPTHLLEDAALDVLLPMTIASFDLQNTNPSLDYAVANSKFRAAIQGASFELYKPWKE